MQLWCQLRTTSEWCCFTYYHTWGITMSNIGCPLGPYIPAVMTCLGCPSPSSSRFTPALCCHHTNHPRATSQPKQTSCNTHITTNLPSVTPGPLSCTPRTLNTFSQRLHNTCVTSMTSVATQCGKI